MAKMVGVRNGEDRAESNSTPWWGQARNLIWNLGPVTVAFCALSAVLLGWLPSPMLTAIQDGVQGLKDNRVIMQAIQREVADHSREMKDQHYSEIRIWRQICRNTAKIPMHNERCDDL